MKCKSIMNIASFDQAKRHLFDEMGHETADPELTYLEVEFVSKPDCFDAYVKLDYPVSITRISEKGISFHLVPSYDLKEKAVLLSTDKSLDMTIFVPWSNIACVTSGGSIRLLD